MRVFANMFIPEIRMLIVVLLLLLLMMMIMLMMMQKMDTDNDGVITIDEFMEACRTVRMSHHIIFKSQQVALLKLSIIITGFPFVSLLSTNWR